MHTPPPRLARNCRYEIAPHVPDAAGLPAFESGWREYQAQISRWHGEGGASGPRDDDGNRKDASRLGDGALSRYYFLAKPTGP